MGLSKASTFSKGLSDIQCSLSIMLDDVVNGNVTMNESSFFIGVDPLITQVNSLSGSITTIQDQTDQL